MKEGPCCSTFRWIVIFIFVSSLLFQNNEAYAITSRSVVSKRRIQNHFAFRRQPLSVLRGGSAEPDGDDEEVAAAVPENEVESSSSSSSSSSVAVAQTPSFGAHAKYPPGFLRKTFPMLPWYKLPDWLTYARCLAIPVLMVLFYAPKDKLPQANLLCSVLFGMASFTDWLDGFLARRWDISTNFGAFLDPVADKLMVSTCLILLAGKYPQNITIPTVIILSRELAISALREWMASSQLRNVVKVGMQGKVKTALTMVSLTLLLMVNNSDTMFFRFALYSLYVSTVLTVTSGYVYFKAAAPYLLAKK